MDDKRIVKEAELILKKLTTDSDFDSLSAVKVVECAYANLLAGTIIANTPTGSDESDDKRHEQLVSMLSDFFHCMKHRFMSDNQVKRIQSGEILKDIKLFSETLMEVGDNVHFHSCACSGKTH